MRLMGLPGFGKQKAQIFVALLASRQGRRRLTQTAGGCPVDARWPPAPWQNEDRGS
jgi:hypothetical protein